MQAHLVHLLKHPEKYQIVALLNSSPQKAKDAIEKFGLPSSTRAYGLPEDLANDPDVELVVCSSRVDKHYSTLLPSVKAGKSVFSEWPLGSNLDQAKELAEIAKSTGARTVVGLQAQHSPYVLKVKEIIESGAIGRVLSTTWTGNAGILGDKPTSPGLKYLGEKAVGGNLLTISFAHCKSYDCIHLYGWVQDGQGARTGTNTFSIALDSVLFALGAELSSFNSLIGNQRPEVVVYDSATKKNVETFTKDTPDQIIIDGYLSNGALVSYHLRGGSIFPGFPALVWRVYGETGEVLLTAQSNAMIMIGSDDITISVHNFKNEEAQKISIDEGEYKALSVPGRNVARLYDAYAEGGPVPDWEWAKKRHALVQEIFVREENGSQVTPAEYTSIV